MSAMRVRATTGVIATLLVASWAPASHAAAPTFLPSSATSPDFQRLQRGFLQRELRAAYDRVGNHDERWDKPARRALDDWIDRLVAPHVAKPEEELLATAQEAIDAGCNDPIVRYCYGRLLREANKSYEAAFALRQAFEGLADSDYSPVFQLSAAHHLAGAIADSGPAAQAAPFLQTRGEILRRIFAEETLKKEERRVFLAMIDQITRYDESFETGEADLKVVLEAATSPWWRDLLKGKRALLRTHHLLRGVRGRLKKEQREKRDRLLNEAEKHLISAWRRDGSLPEVANHLLTVARLRGRPFDEVDKWFQAAVGLDPGYYPPYTQLRYVMQNDWSTAHAEMVARGRDFIASKRFDTVAPFVAIEFATPTIPRVGDPYPPLLAEGVYGGLITMAEGYLAEPSMAWTHDWMRSFRVALAWRCRRWKDGARFLTLLEGDPHPNAFLRLGVHRDEGVGEILARTGGFAETVAETDRLAIQEDNAHAAKLFEQISKSSADERIRRYANRQATLRQRRADYLAGEWINLLSDSELRDWWVHYGDWSFSDRGTLIGRSTLSGLQLVRNEPLGVNYTLEGKVRFVRSHFAGANAGVFFGRPYGRYRRRFPYRPPTAFLFTDDRDEAALVVGRQQEKKKVPVNSESRFRIERRGDVVTTYLNGHLVHESVRLNQPAEDAEQRLAIGGQYWYLNTEIEFIELRIRRAKDSSFRSE